MTPQIALDLSLDGITVLSCAPDGGWWREGTVRLDAPDMPDRMARLRDIAEARAGADFTSILILPDSQLLYTSLERDDRKADETIRFLLKGRTPYPVEDLTFDHIVQGDRLQVAVVALETLLEAETFAAEYGFRPVVVVANPQDPAYPGIANFGKTGLADELLGGTPLSLKLPKGFAAVKAPPLPAPPPPADTEPADLPAAEASVPNAPDDTVNRPDNADHRPAQPTPPPAPVAATPPPAIDAVPAAQATPAAPPETSSVRFSSSRAAVLKDLAPEARAANGERLAKVTPRLTPPPEVPKRASASPILPSPAEATATPAAPPPPATKAEAAGSDTPGKRSRKRAAPKVKAPAGPAGKPASRLTASAAPPPRPKMAPSLAAQTTEPKAPASAAVVATEAATAPAGAIAALALRMKNRKASDARKAHIAPAAAPAEVDRLTEAQALALPGLARERASKPPKSTARLGLVLTLILLGVLIALGAGSFLLGFNEGDVLPEPDTEVATAAAEPEALPALAPLPQRQDDTGAADEAASAPRAEAIDIATLLPASDADVPQLAPSQVPDLITPPFVIASEGAVDVGALSDDQLLAETAPDLAAAPALDTVPVAETEPAIFTESFAAAGELFRPDPLDLPASTVSTASIEGLVRISIDPAIPSDDASGLPRAPFLADLPLRQINPPPPELASDAEAALGLVTATPEGTLAPGGFTVILGRPVLLPLPRPAATDATTANAADAEQAALEQAAIERAEAEAILRRFRPVPRPDDAAEVLPAEAPSATEEALADDPARIALSQVRPRVRPASIVRAAEAAAAEQAAAAAAEQESAAVLAAQQAAAASLASAQAAEASSASISDLALPESDRPRTRPRSVEREAASIVTRRREQAAAAPAAAPSTPAARTVDRGTQTTRSAGGSVARAATETNVLRLNQINLIGVYGQPNARRALVRLANGRYVKVEVGDRLDGGRVTAIGESQLSYQRSGRNQVLRMPRS